MTEGPRPSRPDVAERAVRRGVELPLRTHRVDEVLARALVVGFGRIVVSEKEVPIVLVNAV